MLSLHTNNAQSPRSSANAARTPCIEASHGWNGAAITPQARRWEAAWFSDDHRRGRRHHTRRVNLNEQISGRSSDRPCARRSVWQAGFGRCPRQEIAKRVRNRVLAKSSTWTVPKPDMTGQLGMGSLAYLVTDAELLLLYEMRSGTSCGPTSCVSVQAPSRSSATSTGSSRPASLLRRVRGARAVLGDIGTSTTSSMAFRRPRHPVPRGHRAAALAEDAAPRVHHAASRQPRGPGDQCGLWLPR